MVDDTSRTRVDIKFSFGNCLDDENGIFSHANDNYTPEIRFKRFSNLDDLLGSRLPDLQAGIKAKMSFSLYLIKQEIAFLPSSTT
ncbi:MAG UNVERIFIED_CONTAM: hypothetical protein LVT10_10335 [Anaerolineae bacterium]